MNRPTMRYTLLMFFLLMVLGISGQVVKTEKSDTTLSLFWNSHLKVRINILDPDETNPVINNALLTLLKLENGYERVIFRDSIYVYTILLKIMDLDGDGMPDLLVYNTNNGPTNKSYHLYLVKQKIERLIKVKGFENVFNPSYDNKYCLIRSFETFDKQLISRDYLVRDDGTLGMLK